MFLLNCFISITNPDTNKQVTFNYVTSIEVVSSTKNFTDTAKITVPRKLKYKGKSISDFIRRNNTISISTGYGDSFDLETIFNGYIKSVSTGTPIVIECENASWSLKQIKLPAKHYASLSISNFITEWMSGYTCKVVDVNLGEVRITADTPLAKVFDWIMSNFPIKFYFKNNIFYGVLPGAAAIQNNDVNTIKFRIGVNTISDNLTYTVAEDVKLVIVAKCITRNNTKLEYKTSNDTEGYEIRTFLVPGAESVNDLEVYAKDMLKNFKIDKMTGDFTAFGEPHVRKGDIVHLFDDDHTERDNKKFIVDEVVYSFGEDGYRQKITLGAEIHE